MNKRETEIDENNKFPALMEFLLEQKRCIEYGLEDVRFRPNTYGGKVNYLDEGVTHHIGNIIMSSCLLHNTNHNTIDCHVFNGKSIEERKNIVYNGGACISCFNVGHFVKQYPKKIECGIDGCKRMHHKLLHVSINRTGYQLHTHGNTIPDKACLLQVMEVRPGVLWDSGSTISLVTFNKAKELQLKGKSAKLTIKSWRC